MTPTLTPERLDERYEPLVHHVAKGDQQRRILEFLLVNCGQLERISANDISQATRLEETSVLPLISRLREQLSGFYDYDPEGRKQKQRYVLPSDDRGNYALKLEPNQPPTDLVPSFWNQHPGPRVTVVHSELPSFRDSFGTSFQNPDAVLPEHSHVFADLNISGKLIPSNGFVPAPVVRALSGLTQTFSTWGVPVEKRGVSPLVSCLDMDAIVLGTFASMYRLIGPLEAVAPMRTGAGGVMVRQECKETFHRDTPESAATRDGAELRKFAVVTRHHYRFQRTLTLLTANDDLALEALIPFLANEETLLTLAKALKCRATFPHHFQALICLHLFKGHPFSRHTEVVKAIDLTKPTTARSQRGVKGDAIDADEADDE